MCAGPTILINNTRYATPYIIKAIGDSDYLFDHLDFSEVVLRMRANNIEVSITKNDEVIIEGYQIINREDILLIGGS